MRRFRSSRSRSRARCTSRRCRHASLRTSSRSPGSLLRFSCSRSRLRAGESVHQTMASPSASATRASRMIHSIAAPLHRPWSLASRIRGAGARFLRDDATPRQTHAAPMPATTLPATFARASWSELPGFTTDRVSEAWPALRVGCRALLASARTAPTGASPAKRRKQSTDRTKPRCAHFSPRILAHTRSPSPTVAATGWSPATSSRSLWDRASARRASACRCTPFRTICSSSTWRSCIRSLRIDACARVSRGVASCRTGAGAKSSVARRRSRPRRSPTSPIRSTRSSCRSRAQAASSSSMAASSALGYADQNGHPYRAIANVLIARGEMTLEQASMQAIREWARAQPRRVACAARRESELCVLPRNPAAAARHDRRDDRRAARLARRAAACAPHDRRGLARDSARRAGVACDDAAVLRCARASASCSHRTPAARSAARCAPTSSGVRAMRLHERPDGCARRDGCGSCGPTDVALPRSAMKRSCLRSSRSAGVVAHGRVRRLRDRRDLPLTPRG